MSEIKKYLDAKEFRYIEIKQYNEELKGGNKECLIRVIFAACSTLIALIEVNV